MWRGVWTVFHARAYLPQRWHIKLTQIFRKASYNDTCTWLSSFVLMFLVRAFGILGYWVIRAPQGFESPRSKVRMRSSQWASLKGHIDALQHVGALSIPFFESSLHFSLCFYANLARNQYKNVHVLHCFTRCFQTDPDINYITGVTLNSDRGRLFFTNIFRYLKWRFSSM